VSLRRNCSTNSDLRVVSRGAAVALGCCFIALSCAKQSVDPSGQDVMVQAKNLQLSPTTSDSLFEGTLFSLPEDSLAVGQISFHEWSTNYALEYYAIPRQDVLHLLRTLDSLGFLAMRESDEAGKQTALTAATNQVTVLVGTQRWSQGAPHDSAWFQIPTHSSNQPRQVVLSQGGAIVNEFFRDLRRSKRLSPEDPMVTRYNIVVVSCLRNQFTLDSSDVRNELHGYYQREAYERRKQQTDSATAEHP
jgi:hypothetical protein